MTFFMKNILSFNKLLASTDMPYTIFLYTEIFLLVQDLYIFATEIMSFGKIRGKNLNYIKGQKVKTTSYFFVMVRLKGT